MRPRAAGLKGCPGDRGRVTFQRVSQAHFCPRTTSSESPSRLGAHSVPWPLIRDVTFNHLCQVFFSFST